LPTKPLFVHHIGVGIVCFLIKLNFGKDALVVFTTVYAILMNHTNGN